MEEFENSEELLTADELAAELKVPLGTIRQWATKGLGPRRVKIGRYVRYPRRDVQAWVQSQYVS
ncbi:MAG: helix-turn-helix domain-containing protein [Pseudonocardia sp.]|nr:helix-turn-helix domain-containing protein [Pseudonocardia sp.]